MIAAFHHPWYLAISLSKVDNDDPLGVAADKGYSEIVEKLIESGAVIDHQNKVYTH